MFDPSPFANPTPLAHADTSRGVLPRGGTSQTTNRRVPLAVRSLAAFTPAHGDGTPTGTEVIQLVQQPITELPLANAGKEQRPQVFTLTHNVTNSCYPIGEAVNQPEVLIRQGHCKLILKL
ncbi:hypothetical protein TNCV_694311 [Trichonephila clavipes]|nr:hypothetical protein TNCV_694311 [Trichonephila clavipes]